MEDKIQMLTFESSKKEFPNLKDESKGILYATTFMDGRTLWIAQPHARFYLSMGKVVMLGGIRMKDGSRVGLTIETDGNGDNITIKSSLKWQIRPTEISEKAWFEKINSSELKDLDDEEIQKLIESIGEIADNFLASIKPIVDFRKATYKKIKTALTSSPAQVFRE